MHVSVIVGMILPVWSVSGFLLTIGLHMCPSTKIIHFIVFQQGFHCLHAGRRT